MEYALGKTVVFFFAIISLPFHLIIYFRNHSFALIEILFIASRMKRKSQRSEITILLKKRNLPGAIFKK